MSLEAERFDIGYLKYSAANRRKRFQQQAFTEEQIAQASERRAQELLDKRIPELAKVFFNAGRFAGGQKDDLARMSHRTMLEMKKFMSKRGVEL